MTTKQRRFLYFAVRWLIGVAAGQIFLVILARARGLAIDPIGFLALSIMPSWFMTVVTINDATRPLTARPPKQFRLF